MKALAASVAMVAVLAGCLNLQASAQAQHLKGINPVPRIPPFAYEIEDLNAGNPRFLLAVQTIELPMGSVCVASDLLFDLGTLYLIGTPCTVTDAAGVQHPGVVTTITICAADGLWGMLTKSYSVGTPCSLSDESNRVHFGKIVSDWALGISAAGGIQ